MDKLLTAKELSEKLNLSISKLAIDRMKERGIPFIKWKGQGAGLISPRSVVQFHFPLPKIAANLRSLKKIPQRRFNFFFLCN